MEVVVLSDEERIVLHRLPREHKGRLKASDISRQFPKARYILRRLYDKGHVNRRLVGNVYSYFLSHKGENEIYG